MKEFKSESRLSIAESIGIITGHGVGSGILAVPYLVSKNSWSDFLWILALAYSINLLLHMMIAELSYNNGGAQFVKCFENELFTGKIKKYASYFVFLFLAFSVLMSVSGFIVGSAAVFQSWFGFGKTFSMLLYYVLAGSVVFAGMKFVGICEKYSVLAMVCVMFILLISTLMRPLQALPNTFHGVNNLFALYSTSAFALSAVMSVPQVVKGLNGNVKKIRLSIALGTAVNVFLILLISFMTLSVSGAGISDNGALVDLSRHLGGWVSIVGYIFTILALSTSFWANTLNLRDIIREQFPLDVKLCWLISTLPSLIIAILGIQSFVGFVRIAGVIQVLTGIGIILAYNHSRKKAQCSPICGKFSSLPFQILVISASLLASYGSILSIK